VYYRPVSTSSHSVLAKPRLSLLLLSCEFILYNSVDIKINICIILIVVKFLTI